MGLSLISSGPADGSRGIIYGSNLEFRYNTKVYAGPGNIYIRVGSSNGNIIQFYSPKNDPNVLVDGNDLTLLVDWSKLSPSSTYYVTFDQGALMDVQGTKSDPISNYDFTTSTSFTNTKFNSQYGYYSVNFNNKSDQVFDAIYDKTNSKYYVLGYDTNIAGSKTYFAQADFNLSSDILSTDTGYGATYINLGTKEGLLEDLVDGGSNTMRIHGGAVDALGRFIVVGTVSAAGQDSKGFIVARYLADGSRDLTFGVGGKIEIDLSTNGLDEAWSITIQHDLNDPNNASKDKYVIGGTVNVTSLGIIRLGADIDSRKRLFMSDG